MNLKDLQKIIPYKWRVQSFSKNKPMAQCVAYIDSRDVQKLLDEVVGAENWQDKYYSENGMLFCSIGIKCGDEWVWKTDTGSESNMDAQKGHSSDAFKRAAVKWGIGRFLYDLKIHYVKANAVKDDGQRKLPDLKYEKFPYCIDDMGKRIWDLNEYINNLKQ